ncbi:MAG: YqzL family protein [Clostridia bacterium]|nr:YqzL family protein [Oscillospiraceae bacterium]MBQ7960680.1 YqzL family protein [Clostridia bacterium]
MGKLSDLAWKVFEKTGGVKEYLKYRTVSEMTQDSEVGGELGAFEDRRNSNKNHKI